MISSFRRIRHQVMRTRVRAPLIWLRHCGLDRSDVFLASYPRSGNTWTRFLLTEILATNASFDNVNFVIPEMGIHARAQLTLPSGGRLIKTHEPYRSEYRRAVYLVRDFRDVVLSQFSRERELGMHSRSLEEYLPDFLEGRLSGFGAWHDHLPSWLDSPLAASGNLLVVKFEEMRRDPEPVISRIARFLGYEVSSSVIRQAIENNSVEQMRVKENAAKTLPKSNREEGRFVRKGAIAGWREKLTEQQLRLIDQKAGDVLVRVGYPLAFPEEAASEALSAAERYASR